MTVVGAGGVVIARWQMSRRFRKDYARLSNEGRARVDEKLKDLAKNPRPSGLRFEKLKGYSDPDVYTVHITGGTKLSMSIEGSTATLRRVASHDEIDRAP